MEGLSRRPSEESKLPAEILEQSTLITRMLQTTLDTEALMELFFARISKLVPMDGLEFFDETRGLHLIVGKKARNRNQYNLVIGDDSLGSLRFSSRVKFSETDSIALEYLLCTLLYPLRNALMYRDALYQARRDALTGTYNRAAFDEQIQDDVNLARRHGTPLSMIVLDIDHFKRINDDFGHAIGDQAIQALSDTAQSCIRNTDMLFRYGGEEFVVLLRNTDRAGAQLLADRIRAKVEKLVIPAAQGGIRLTVSAGVGEYQNEERPEALFLRSDNALYRAKDSGRNKVCCAD